MENSLIFPSDIEDDDISNAAELLKIRLLSNNMNMYNEKPEIEEDEDENVEPQDMVLEEPRIKDEILSKLAKKNEVYIQSFYRRYCI